MASTVLKNHLPLSPTTQETEPNNIITLTEWGLKTRLVSRENSISRRFSASYLRNLRDDTKSFRSNFTISSTTSSPGYPLFKDFDQEIIDPSTYSFTNAIRALQARSSNCWEMISPSREGICLNSKWTEAEKYISNPLSGEVPIACLSSKTLENTSFRHLTGKITMSAPLLYSSLSRQPCPVSPLIISHDHQDQDQELHHHFPHSPDKKLRTRDVGTQSSTPLEVSSRGSSPIQDQNEIIKKKTDIVDDDSLLLSIIAKLKFDDKVEVKEVSREKGVEEEEEKKGDMELKKSIINGRKKTMTGRCLPWKGGLWVVCKSGQRRSGEEQKTSCSNRQRKKSISVHNHII
ncbi:uncharacterized protein LOC124922418 isoform X2 [Impatiens glandulifera]|uniref:uncharacterized protein LOC124922418 isoform X2 n=1 Tax=Impatiens glandulifera TaxID=253017 RepID=UPI001FB1284C|nr:uncharacterized protein LOC124922418 isoform X2 [Impatiens glandulifera]